MRILIGGLALAVLGGCASSPVPYGDASPAPAERVYAYQAAKNGNSNIMVTRDSGFVGAGCFATIFLNGKPVARLNPSERASFIVPAGEWTVGAGLDGKALCGANPERLETDLLIKPGQTKKFRVYTSTGGEVGVRPTTF